VARPTRSQRRARRQAQLEQQQQQAAPSRARARQQSSSTSVRVPADEPRRAPRERKQGGFVNFVAESWAELKKVEWPGQRQVVTGTIVVIVACLIVGGYLWIADLALKRFVENVLLGQ
jgi:preprotein translocase subunit SecE